MSSWYWIVLVLLTFAVAAYGFLKLSGSRDWISTQGKVTSASIEPIYRSNTQQSAVADQSFNYKVNIRYEYSVDGQTFMGDQLTAGLPNIVTHKNDADDLLTTYSPDSISAIYYNPANPSQSALITGKSIPIAGFIIIGVMIIVIIVGISFIIKSGILN